jgi:hypothetical protein
MVPSIVQLELSRLEQVIEGVQDRPELRNALVEARRKLEGFVECLQRADKQVLEESCAPRLEAALLTISMKADAEDGEVADTLHYIVDRLTHVHDRMELIY